MNNYKLIILLVTLTLISCKATELDLDEEKSAGNFPVNAAKPLSDTSYNNLTVEQQYQVANKIASTVYKGVPVADFFDFRAYGNTFTVGEGKDFLSKFRQKLNTKEKNKAGFALLIDQRYSFNERRKPVAEPLATIREYPISRDMFEAWMAYKLANTILFSPAEEIDSADYIDVQRIYTGLVKAMSEDVSIRDIIYTHMTSQANWRRFRSPEDNTREMIEIYLGLFDRDDDVPKASIACKNWYITDGDGNYERVIDTLNENTEPQFVLDQWVTTCEDFYRVVANHSLVIPRVTTFLVDHFFPNYSVEKRLALTKDIVATDPQRFHDIFLAIIFSEEYLLYNEKSKSFEETFFNLAERTQWVHRSGFLNDLTNPSSGSPTMHKMMQPAMSLKLGRFKDQPLDSQSFANYHSAVRERLLTRSNNDWGSWGGNFVRQGDFFDQDDFVDFLFMSVVSRKSTEEERTELKSVFISTDNESDRVDQTRIVFDYISRLPELYYSNAIVGAQ